MIIGRIFRLLAIQRILIKYRLDEIIFATHLFRPVHFLQYLMPWNWLFNARHQSRAVRLRCMLEELGPIYIKLGQLLSTRRDLLPEDIVDELAKLQDCVPPFPGHTARRIIEDTYSCKLEDIFVSFDTNPLASASMAQVHSAKLEDGKEYIVKVVRPGIEKLICKDLSLLFFLAKQAERYYPDGHTLGFSGVVKELEKTLLNELDLRREAANAAQLRRNFKDEVQYYVPAIHWQLSRKNVMVMERVSGISIANISALKAAKIDLKWLAEYGVKIFFTQLFRDNFFHADMHPGNIFVSLPEQGQCKVMVVDFGIMSSLTEFDQRYLAENFLAFLDRDYQRVAKLHIESGWVPEGTRSNELEFAVRTVCEPLLDQAMHQISFGELLKRLFQIARKFNVEIMPQLILLQKTIINIEGVGRQLYPELNLWETARPQLKRWMNERAGIKAILKNTKKNIPYWIDHLPSLPGKLVDLVTQLQAGRLAVQNNSEDIKQLREEMRTYNKRTILAVVGAGLLLCAAILYGLGSEAMPMFSGAPIISWLAALFGSYLLLAAFHD